jgi:hypothetical protein
MAQHIPDSHPHVLRQSAALREAVVHGSTQTRCLILKLLTRILRQQTAPLDAGCAAHQRPFIVRLS